MRTRFPILSFLLFCALLTGSATALPSPTSAAPLPLPEFTVNQDPLRELFEKGAQALARHDLRTAEAAWAQAYDIAQAQGERYSMGVFLDGLGSVYSEGGQFQKAMDFYQRALAIREALGRKADIARTLCNLGVTYRSAGQLEKAASSYARGVALWEELDAKEVAASYSNDLGGIYSEMGHYQKALAIQERALQIQEGLGNPVEISRSLGAVAGIYYHIGQYAKATTYYQRGLSLITPQKDPRGYAILLSNLGNVHLALGQNEPALKLHTQSLAIKEPLGDKRDTAAGMGNLANVYCALGRFDQGITLYNRALQLAQETGVKHLIATQFSNLGVTYNTLGQPKKALEYYLRTLTLLEEGGSPQRIASLLGNIGGVQINLGNLGEAHRCFTRALTLEQPFGNKSHIAGFLTQIGDVHSRLRQFEPALDAYRRALALQEAVGNPRDIAATLNNMAVTYQMMGQSDQAAQTHERALKIKRGLGNPRELAVSLSNLALLYTDLGQLDKAAPLFAESIQANESVSAQIKEASQVGAYQETAGRGMYTRYAALLQRQNKPEEALVMVERGRGQGLARQALQNREGSSRFLTPKDAERLKASAAEVQAATRQLHTLEEQEDIFDRGERDAVRRQIAAARKRLNDAETALQQIRAELYERSPQYRRLYGAKPVSMEELKALAKSRPDTLFLEWAIGLEGTSLLFALSDTGGLKAFTLPIGASKLREMIAAWRETITEGDSPQAGSEPARARALYEALFGPVEKMWAEGKEKSKESADALPKRLVLIGDGPLLELPFAALLDANGKRLVERFPLSTSSSLGVLTWPEEPGKPTRTLFCAADSLGPGGSALKSSSRGSFAPLPAARQEGKEVAALFPNSAIVIGEGATKSAVMKQIDKFALLHFATHGALDDEEGLRSGVMLAPEANELTDEAVLEAQEIMEMKLTARMVVLSACETGLGQKSGGEGLLGLSWAFRAAGCPSIVASQWSVEDESTAHLMVAFYKALKAGKRKDDALREAMLTIKKQPERQKPAYWAAFQITGDTSPLVLTP